MQQSNSQNSPQMNPANNPANQKDIFYPPGGILLWMILGVELLTIFMGIIFFSLDHKSSQDVFQQSIVHNSFYIGLFNTFVLLASGFFIAQAVHKFAKNSADIISKELLMSMGLGVVFVLVKLYEYKMKLNAGNVIGSNSFFTYYWFFTLFHLFHVLIGISLIGYAVYKIKKKSVLEFSTLDPIGLFWHMCDLIWIIIFPLFYKPPAFLSGFGFPILFFLVKSIVVLYFFMNVRKAHIFWKVLSGTIIIAFTMTTLLN